jgi:release factor glutamine methyltransferase
MKTYYETVSSATNYFREELKNQFELSELYQILQITFTHYFSLEKADLILNKEDFFLESDFDKLKTIISELKTNKPLAQIIGEWEFFDLTFKVTESTLIPRPETEELVQLIIDENNNQKELSILDIGTGSGCIAISLKNNLPNTNVTAYDISDAALSVASENAISNNVSVGFKKVDILNADNQKINFDVIVSNPPYITVKEKKLMHENVLAFEPHLALFVDNETPLVFYISIANFAIEHLNKGGKLYFEINEYYGVEVKEMLQKKGFKKVNIVKDINDKDRIVSCTI